MAKWLVDVNILFGINWEGLIISISTICVHRECAVVCIYPNGSDKLIATMITGADDTALYLAKSSSYSLSRHTLKIEISLNEMVRMEMDSFEIDIMECDGIGRAEIVKEVGDFYCLQSHGYNRYKRYRSDGFYSADM